MTSQLHEHMTRQHRTERLYETLKGMGLFVTPIYVDDEIDSLHVAVRLPAPRTAEEAAKAGVVPPVEGAKVPENIRSPESGGANVVHFPPVL